MRFYWNCKKTIKVYFINNQNDFLKIYKQNYKNSIIF